MEPREWKSVGQIQEVTSHRQLAAQALMEQELEQALQRGEHYWLALVGFRVQPPLDEGSHLDAENIRVLPSIGCFICEEPWSERMGHRRCKGERS